MKKKTLILAITIPTVIILSVVGTSLGIYINNKLNEPVPYTGFPVEGTYVSVENVKEQNIGIVDFYFELKELPYLSRYEEPEGYNGGLNAFCDTRGPKWDPIRYYYIDFFYKATEADDFIHANIQYDEFANPAYTFRFLEDVPVKARNFCYAPQWGTITFRGEIRCQFKLARVA